MTEPNTRHLDAGSPGKPATSIIIIGLAQDVSILEVDATGPDGMTAWDEKVTYPWDFAAGVVSVVSENVADVETTGAGLWSVQINGLDVDGREQTEIIPLNGLTPVAGTKLFYRVNLIEGVLAGSSRTNEGIVRASIDGTVIAHMSAWEGRSLSSHFTVPATWKAGAQLTQVQGNILKKQSASVAYKFRAQVPGFARQRLGSWGATSDGGIVTWRHKAVAIMAPMADLSVTFSSLDTNNVDVEAGYDLMRVAF